MGVAQLHDVVYVVSRESSKIRRFSATTQQRLTDIDVKGLKEPRDIAACERTSQLYVADCPISGIDKCIWRVSYDGVDIQHWLPKSPSDTFGPWTLSVTATRLLVTSTSTIIGYHSTNTQYGYPSELIQFDAGGDELRRVRLPGFHPDHAVESPAGTFIVSHRARFMHTVSEVDNDGRVMRHFSGSSFGFSRHIAVDSQGNIFVADFDNHRILLLDAQLSLRRVIIDEHQLNYKPPWRLCYIERSGQLLVGLYRDNVAVFDVLHR